MGVGYGVVIVNRGDEGKRAKSEDQGKNRAGGTFRGGGKPTTFVGKTDFFLKDKHSCILVKALFKAKVKCSHEIPRRD